MQPIKNEFKQLIKSSKKRFYNAFELLDWDENIPENTFWMSPELISLYGLKEWEDLNGASRHLLSKWELINFCSINMYGEKELVEAVVKRLYHPKFNMPSEYFHNFLDEENKHMWIFAKFCKKYGGKIYPNNNLRFSAIKESEAVNHFLSFARITIFEEIGDYYNFIMMNDESLPKIVRELNRQHHLDESRHLAAGRLLLIEIYKDLEKDLSESELELISEYLKNYMKNSVEMFYNPSVYKDAGMTDVYSIRRNAVSSPYRIAKHKDILYKTLEFFISNNIIKETLLS